MNWKRKLRCAFWSMTISLHCSRSYLRLITMVLWWNTFLMDIWKTLFSITMYEAPFVQFQLPRPIAKLWLHCLDKRLWEFNWCDDTVIHPVCGTGSMNLPGVRPFVCLSVQSFSRRVCCCGSGWQEIDSGAAANCAVSAAMRYRSTAARPALNSECEQCRVVSWRIVVSVEVIYRSSSPVSSLQILISICHGK